MAAAMPTRFSLNFSKGVLLRIRRHQAKISALTRLESAKARVARRVTGADGMSQQDGMSSLSSTHLSTHSFSKDFNPESDFYLDFDQITMHQRIGGGEFSDVYLGSYFGDKARARALERARARALARVRRAVRHAPRDRAPFRPRATRRRRSR